LNVATRATGKAKVVTMATIGIIIESTPLVMVALRAQALPISRA
jgi:hypothetical protein